MTDEVASEWPPSLRSIPSTKDVFLSKHHVL